MLAASAIDRNPVAGQPARRWPIEAPEIGAEHPPPDAPLPRVGLGTLEPGGGPYVSLAMVALDHDAAPLLYLSDLADHTKNLKRDPRVSLLFDGTLDQRRAARRRARHRAGPDRAHRPMRGCSRAMWPAIPTPPPMPASATSISIACPSSGRTRRRLRPHPLGRWRGGAPGCRRPSAICPISEADGASRT